MDDIVILSEPIDPATLRRLVERFFGDMVKLVVDVEDPAIRRAVEEVVHALVGRGEEV